ncbi:MULTISPECIES: dihydrofolate reductase family protein [Actinoalloteichus]|uniref:Dihydrofolate reductase n=1 Tax=Actinoalloteichus fjordicus TaxID=1612552 RepID=A0AAC9LF11_9PSEU|nr:MULTISPECIES: dihydrofolate reductase family protein [Actinoalloteichus]APU15115.1 dihydrofolate reductase [Actinoalloteichus fjordicus]APU21183.1 dihydrofolate reductase [Actinoalloteichus sp. GBA129-24]
MRKLVYFVAATLDGFIAGPDGSDPTGPDGFWTPSQDYLEHLIGEYPETLPGQARAALGVTAEGTHFDTVVEGRKSYQIGIAAGVTNAYPHLRHLVFSRTLTESPDVGVELVADDPAATVRELKHSGGKDIWLVGGAELAGALYGEIDRMLVKLSPITIGAGIPLFGRTTGFAPANWELADHTILTGGACFLTYDRRPATR